MKGKYGRAGQELTALEMRGARALFATGLRGADVVDAYWIPGQRGLKFRSASKDRIRSPFKLPPDAILVGRFDRKCTPAEFAEELDGFVATLATEKAA